MGILCRCNGHYHIIYPKTVSLKPQLTKHEANELINVVIRVGLPSETSADQGTNFMSSLLNEVYKLLKIPPSPTQLPISQKQMGW